MYFVRIGRFGSLLLPVWSILSVNSINIGETEQSNMNVLLELVNVIPRLPCLFNTAKAVSSIVVLVNSETSDSGNSYNFEICTFARKHYPMVLVPCAK
jgi:hypothetical protein